jgi:CRP-like cAMP-binding protein
MEGRMQGMTQMVTQRAANPGRHMAIAAQPRPEPRDALDLLEQFGTNVTVERDQEILCQGDRAEYCYKILRGCVRQVKLLEDGRRQVGEFLMAGDLFGFDALDTHDFAAEAVSHVVLRRYPRRMVEALAESQFAFARRLRDLAAVSLRLAHGRLMLLGRKTASERIASFVLEMAERLPGPTDRMVELPMNRTDMADHLGLTIETVCRVLAVLRREGTIAVARGGVEIRDRAGLELMASEPRH